MTLLHQIVSRYPTANFPAYAQSDSGSYPLVTTSMFTWTRIHSTAANLHACRQILLLPPRTNQLTSLTCAVFWQIYQHDRRHVHTSQPSGTAEGACVAAPLLQHCLQPCSEAADAHRFLINPDTCSRCLICAGGCGGPFPSRIKWVCLEESVIFHPGGPRYLVSSCFKAGLESGVC